MLETAGLNRPAVVSWDPWGVARLAAARRPELFGSMVLVNPSRSTRKSSGLLSESDEPTVSTGSPEEMVFPSRFQDPDFGEWLARAVIRAPEDDSGFCESGNTLELAVSTFESDWGDVPKG